MKRWLFLAAIYLILALMFAAPLLPRLTTAFPHDTGDPVLNAWLLWWNTQHVPFSTAWWNAPMFHPVPDVMALSEVLIGLVPISAVVQWITGSPLAAYNTAFILTFPLCALAAAFLALEITGRWDAAALAGLAFAFAPYRMGQLSHLQMLAYYGAPFALAGLHRYVRTGQRRWLALFAGGWLVQALSNGYALFHVAVLIALWIAWFLRTRRQCIDVALAWIVGSVPLVPLLLKYRQVHVEWHLARDINEIKRFGVDLADFASAPPELWLWGARLWTARPETAVFPGITLLIVFAVWAVVEWRASPRRTSESLAQKGLTYVSLAAGLVAISALTMGPWRVGPLSVGDFHKPLSIAVYARLLSLLAAPSFGDAWRRRSTVMFYVVGLVAMYLLALGPEPRLLGRPLLYEPPYAWLMRLPGFATLRVPGRFAMLAVLCQAILLACAVRRWSFGPPRRAVVALVATGLLADGWARLPVAAAPPAGAAIAANATAVVELPVGLGEVDFPAIYRQMSHGRPIVNGYSGYNPPHYLPLVDAVAGEQAGVLAHLDRDGFIQAVIDRGRGDAPRLAAMVEAIPGVEPLPMSERWLRYLVPQRRIARRPSAPLIPLAGITTSVANRDAVRAHDGDIETGWSSGANQIGNEQVILDLGLPQSVGAVVIEMGAFAFGYPRDLAIDVAREGGGFDEIWRGRPAPLVVTAALDRLERVPFTIEIGPVTTDRLRLRQLGTSPGIPWWIPELTLHRPAPGPVP